ncbi:hypothetical protein H310_02482 [Aphanomyces invadans]|uniref:DUF4203 domain-containing protein n=1 Tax=Aphanomyces invadans TaxID=157072 RepID=A0A024UQK8_9STRA|nr:hypothetical protein H310_02482 [Aphanomyces invadans]ETW08142.1 hypothetical protein H310_02482 [Aphanomyces invadans]|eukprot:XP_008864235.1 hypothetical protein H310_02482 [Aphanomyces invadans]
MQCIPKTHSLLTFELPQTMTRKFLLLSVATTTVTATRSLGDGDTWDYLPALIFIGAGSIGGILALGVIFAGVKVMKLSTLLSTCWLCFYFAYFSGRGMVVTVAAVVAILIAVVAAVKASSPVSHFVCGAAVVLCVADAITYVVQVDASFGGKESWKEHMMVASIPCVVYSTILALLALGHGVFVAKFVRRACPSLCLLLGGLSKTDGSALAELSL